MCRKFLLFVPALTLLVSVAVHAQPKQDTVVTNLREVVITSRKFPTPLRDAAGPVDIITSADIIRSGATDISQLLQSRSGIIINGAYSNPSLNRGVYVRGAASDYALVLLDGVPIIDPSGLAGALDLRLLPLGRIERIEIVKGSQSSLYGSGAVSGVINIITKRASDKEIAVQGRLALGSLGLQAGLLDQASLDVGGTLGKFTYHAGAQQFYTDGLSEAAPKAGSTAAPYERDKFSQVGTNLRLGFSPTKEVEISPYVHFTRSAGDFDAGPAVDATTNHYQADWINVGLAANYQSTKRPLKARATYGYTHNDNVFYNSNVQTTALRGRLHDADVYATYDFLKEITLTAGLNYQEQHIATGSSPSTDIISPYFRLSARPLTKLLVEVGYRLNVHSVYRVNSTYSVNASYQIVSSVQVFASYNTGYKAPTINQLYGSFGANASLKPQTSSSWEAGVQTHFKDDALTLTATYYNRQIDDWINYEQVPDPANPQMYISRYRNAGFQRNNGVELAAAWQIIPQLRVSASYDFVMGTTTWRRSGLPDSTYSNLLRIPTHSFKFSITCQPVQRLLVSFNGQYLGRRRDVFFEGFSQKSVFLDPYFLLNAYAEYKAMRGKLAFFVDLKNITDTRFYEPYGYTGLPFGIKAGVSFQL